MIIIIIIYIYVNNIKLSGLEVRPFKVSGGSPVHLRSKHRATGSRTWMEDPLGQNMCVYIYIYIYVYMYTCMCMYRCMCMCMCIYICIYIYICVCTYLPYSTLSANSVK